MVYACGEFFTEAPVPIANIELFVGHSLLMTYQRVIENDFAPCRIAKAFSELGVFMTSEGVVLEVYSAPAWVKLELLPITKAPVAFSVLSLPKAPERLSETVLA